MRFNDDNERHAELSFAANGYRDVSAEELHSVNLGWFSEIIAHGHTYDEIIKIMPSAKENAIKRYISQHGNLNIIKAVIILDDEDELSNWDYCEAESLEETIESIDGGYGILRNAMQK